ncbi:MAG TPA: SUMF1/EgtB/PvdO family nonheme iron enzyme [Bryobacteraceae bacterium]|jgi:formylglycine-generating enzyme required for sulfatase activity
MEHAVFISYSSTDHQAAEQICTALEKSGYGCWIAPRDIEPGADYPTAILNGVEQARVVVVIISEAAVASPHILTEIGHAFGDKKPIIPFRLSDAKLPPNFDYFLSMSQWLEATDGCTSENLARLNEAVGQALSGAPAAVQEKRKKRILPAVAVCVIATAGILYWRSPAAKTGAGLPPPKTDANPAEPKGPQPWVNPKDGLTYVWIPPGSFTMGCSPNDTECKPDERPAHTVQLPAGFWMGQTEVTNEAYRRVVPSATFPASEEKLPVIGISWTEAKQYCAAIGGRLPTEAEWEYAARGGSAGPYYGTLADIAWYGENSDGVRHEVAARKPNGYGLYDVLGNASEWVLDRYYNAYDLEAPALGNVEQPLPGNASALTRGGFWESEAANIRVSHRIPMDKDEPGPMAGIRCIAAGPK